MKRYLISFILLFFIIQSYAQEFQGGNRVFTFLSTPSSARQSALGQAHIAYNYRNSSIVFSNPALLSIKAHRNAHVDYQFNYADTRNGSVSYSHSIIDSLLIMNAGVKFFDSGEFQGRDIYDNNTGTFSAKDFAFHLAASYQLYDNLRVGLTTKFISSKYEVYTSNGIAFDLGFYYSKPNSENGISLVLKNFGTQLKTFVDDKEKLPTDLQLGYGFRFKYIPFRMQFVYHHLNQWNLYHEDANDPESGGSLFGDNEVSNFNKWSDNLLRHLGVSGELMLGSREQVVLRVSYDRQINRELRLERYRSLAGLGLGVGFNFNRLDLSYAYNVNHLAAGIHYFGLALNIVPKKQDRIVE